MGMRTEKAVGEGCPRQRKPLEVIKAWATLHGTVVAVTSGKLRPDQWGPLMRLRSFILQAEGMP